MINLGQKVTDSITGFTGIAVSRHEYLYGCVRIGVESTELKDGKPIDCCFDEQRLDGTSKVDTGGPSEVPGPRYIPPVRSAA